MESFNIEIAIVIISDLSELCKELVNLYTLLLFVLLLLVYTISRYAESDIPGPFAFPLIGNTLDILKAKEEKRHIYYGKLRQEYGDIYRLYYGRTMIVFLNSYDVINEAFVKKADVFSHRPDFLLGISGNGVIFSNGSHWKNIRKLAHQVISISGLGDKFIEGVVTQEVHDLAEQFKLTKGQAFAPMPLIGVATSNVIHNIVFGVRYEHNDTYFKGVLFYFEELFKRTEPLLLSKFFPVVLVYKLWQIHRRVREVFEHTKQQILKAQKSFDSNHVRNYIDLYTQKQRDGTSDKECFCQENLFRSVLDLFFAGTETSSTLLEWALLYMIEYPNIQRKCQEEIAMVVDDNKTVTLDDRKKMPYITATICEIMRRCTVVPLTLPHMATEKTSINGYRIPKNALLVADLSAILLDPRYWVEPKDFRPERFLDEAGNLSISDKFIPFSVGPRRCLGETLGNNEIFLFFTNLLHGFNFVKENESDEFDFDGVLGISRASKHYQLRAIPR